MSRCLLFAAAFALLTSSAFAQGSSRPADSVGVSAYYNPKIDPAHFTHVITNRYYAPKPGMRATYEKATSKGITRVELSVTGKTKKVMGVTTLVVRVQEWVNDELIEDTRNWVAQDRHDNVWCFGEAVRSYRGGKLVDREGSWKAGVDGAKPGILMLGEPKAGDTFRQEYYPGKAEDMGTVVAVGKRLTVPRGAFFENCVQILDWNRISEGGVEHKYYCVGLGLMVLEEAGAERLALVSFSMRPPRGRFAQRGSSGGHAE